jgi:hypothetical protein
VLLGMTLPAEVNARHWACVLNNLGSGCGRE